MRNFEIYKVSSVFKLLIGSNVYSGKPTFYPGLLIATVINGGENQGNRIPLVTLTDISRVLKNLDRGSK